jgi:hypothetical protein
MQLALTPDECWRYHVELSTSATTIDLAPFASITAILIVNRSTTAAETVLAQWYHQQGSQTTETGTSGITFAQAATGDTVVDEDGNTTFVTNGAVVGDWLRVTSSASNDGAYALRTVTDGDNLALVVESTVTAETDTTVGIVLSFEHRNKQGITASNGQLLITDNIVPAGDLVLTADSGTPEVDVYVVGS